MLKYNIKQRYNIQQINKNLYNFKNKIDFDKEFEFE